MEEVWVKVKYNFNYEVSNLGRVRRLEFTKKDSLGRSFTYKRMYMKINRNGSTDYRGVYLQGISYRLHRLIFFSFNPEADESLEINHIDHDKHNNKLSNLELVTRQQNVDAYLDFSGTRSKKCFCSFCGVTVSKGNSRCINCYDKQRLRKVENRPSKDTLLKDLSESNYVQVGKKYGVSDNTIRKWLK